VQQSELDDLIRSLIPNADAANMVIIVSRMVRHSDNCADNENETPTDAMANAMNCALVELGDNAFYAEHRATFAPMLSTIYQVWAVSEELRWSTLLGQRQWAFAWRDLIAFVLYHTATLANYGPGHVRFVIRSFLNNTIDSDTETFAQWDATGFATFPARSPTPTTEEIL
jgi:hypothetical protein